MTTDRNDLQALLRALADAGLTPEEAMARLRPAAEVTLADPVPLFLAGLRTQTARTWPSPLALLTDGWSVRLEDLPTVLAAARVLKIDIPRLDLLPASPPLPKVTYSQAVRRAPHVLLYAGIGDKPVRGGVG